MKIAAISTSLDSSAQALSHADLPKFRFGLVGGHLSVFPILLGSDAGICRTCRMGRSGCHHKKSPRWHFLALFCSKHKKKSLWGVADDFYFFPLEVSHPKLQINITQLLVVAQRRVKAQPIAFDLGLQEILISGPRLEMVIPKGSLWQNAAPSVPDRWPISSITSGSRSSQVGLILVG